MTLRAFGSASRLAMPSPMPPPEPVTMMDLSVDAHVLGSPPVVAMKAIADRARHTGFAATFRLKNQPCLTATVFNVVNPYSASKPFSRP